MANETDLSKKASETLLELIAILNREHGTILSEIARMKNITAEASSTLRQSFHGFNNEYSELVTNLKNNASIKEFDSSVFNSLLAKGITALQFEDIIQQLLDHAQHRVSAIETMLHSLGNEINQFTDAEPKHEDIIDLIKICQSVIDSTQTKLELENPVNQESMDEGDITLF